MHRDPRAYLWDIREAADAIAQFISGIDQARYHDDPLVRSAVERKLEVIGEALSQLGTVAPELASSIPEPRQGEGLRNVLIHGYAAVDDALVWRTACHDVPRLRANVASLLAASSRDE